MLFPYISSLISLTMISLWSVFYHSNLDRISVYMVWLTCLVVLLCILSSHSVGLSFVHTMYWMVLFTATIFAFTSQTLFSFYIFFELSLIPMILMIFSLGEQPERISSSLYFLTYTLAFSLPMLSGLLVLSKYTPLLMLSSIKLLSLNSVCVLLLMLPFLVKLPVFGLHYWLPKAHVEASTSGSIVLASVLLKLGGYGVIRILSIIPQSSSLLFKTSMIWLVASLMSATSTCNMVDLKKLVAFSSVTHMTMLLLILGTTSAMNTWLFLLASLSHSWAASMMFYMSGHSSHNAESRLIFLNSKSELSMCLILGFGLVCNASIPPFPSFFAELGAYITVFSKALFSMAFIVITSLFILYYNLYLFLSMSTVSELSSGSKSITLSLLISGMITLSLLISGMILMLPSSFMTLVCGTKGGLVSLFLLLTS